MTVAEIFEKPKNWCQNTFIQDKNGNWMSYNEISSPKAFKWCLAGAIYKSCKEDFKKYLNIRSKIEKTMGTDDICNWNDNPNRTHA